MFHASPMISVLLNLNIQFVQKLERSDWRDGRTQKSYGTVAYLGRVQTASDAEQLHV